MSKKWVLFIFITLVFLAVLSQALLQSRFISKKVGQFSEAKIEQLLGQKVSIEKTSLSLFPPSVIFKAFSIHPGPSGQLPSFFARKISIIVSPVSLFTEVFFVRKIEIDSPEIQMGISLNTSNDGNFPLLNKTQTKTDKGTEPSPPAVIIRAVHISNGDLSLKGSGPVKVFSLQGVDAVIRPDLKMNRFELDLSARKGAFSGAGINNRVIDRFEAQLIAQPGKVDLKKGLIASGEGSLLADGTVYFRTEDQFALQVDLHFPLEMAGPFALSQGGSAFIKENRISGGISFSGNLTGAMDSPVFIGEIILPTLAIDEEKAGSLFADFSYREKELSLSEVSGKFFSGSFSGKAKVVLDDPPPHTSENENEGEGFKAEIEYEDIPIDRLIRLLPREKPSEYRLLKGLFATGDLSLSGPGIHMDTVRASGSVIAKRLPLFSPPLTAGAAPIEKLASRFQSGRLFWEWSSDGLDLNEGEMNLPRTQLAFHGAWNQTEGLALETSLISQDVSEVAEMVRFPLSGELQAKGMLTNHGEGPLFKGRLQIKRGTIRGQAFDSFSSEIDIKGKQIHFIEAALKVSPKTNTGSPPASPGHYRANGKLDLNDPKSPRFDFKAEVKSGNPQDIFAFFKLKLPLYTVASGSLIIRGMPRSFFVKGPLVLSEGSLYGEDFDEGSLDLTVTEKEVLLRNVILKKKESILSGKGAIRYNKTYWLSIKGDRLPIQETHFLNWMPDSLTGRVGLIVSGKGSLKKPQLRFVAAVTDLYYGELEGARGTIRADWVNHSVDFEANFPHENIAMNGEVQLAPFYPFSFEGKFDRFRIDTLFKQYLSGPASDVTLQASGRLRGSGKLFKLDQVNLSGLLTELSAIFGEYKVQNDGPIPILAKEGTFSFSNTRLKGNNTALVLNGELRILKRWNLLLNGEADLNLITFFSEKISSGRGRAFLDLVVTDQWESPRIRGELTLKEGSIRTLNLSQPVRITSLTALFNEKELVLEDLNGKLGGGTFFATGKAGLSGFRVGDFGFLLELEKVRLDLSKNLPGTFDGALFFKRKGLLQTLKGDLTLNHVAYEEKIDLKKLVGDFNEKSGSDLSEGTPLIGRTKINIHLYGNKEIWIANNLAKIPLEVDLFVRGSFDNPRLLGQIDISSGNIYFGNNTFEVISGSVDFLDPNQINPMVNLSAKTKVRNVVTDRRYDIDINLSGTLSQVTLTWNSFPSLPESDIFSLLAIGKTAADLGEIKGGAGTEVGNFVVGKVLSGPVDQLTSLVGDPVEKVTGIDHIRVDPYIDGSNATTTAGTRLTAEKRLMNDRLVVIYSTTLDPSQEELIRMVYEVNQHISLVGKRDSYGQVGGDIRFRFEFR